jgi:hypothetical protein
MSNSNPDPRWRDLYRVGTFACVAMVALTVAAVTAYFIWPYTPGSASVAEIFASLQKNMLGALVSLDLSTVILPPIFILEIAALYAALRAVNESYALIAMVVGLMGTLLWLTARPLMEMAYLSGRYADAAGDMEKLRYMAASEAFKAVFGGTSWMISQIFIGASSVISSILMLKSRIFGRATAYIGILVSVAGFGVVIPSAMIAAVLGLGATIGGSAWYILLAGDFFRAFKRLGGPRMEGETVE